MVQGPTGILTKSIYISIQCDICGAISFQRQILSETDEPKIQ